MKTGVQVTNPTTIAKLTSRLLHPCFLSIGLLLVAPAVYGEASSLAASAAVVFLLSLIAALYVRARTATTEISLRSLETMTEYLRHHPRDVVVLVLISGLPSTALLAIVGAPLLSFVMAATLTLTALALALVNLKYRASYHVAAVTSLALVSAVFWEATLPIALTVIPLVAWARYYLGHHTAVQISVGCVIAAVVSISTFGVLNLVGLL